MQVENHIPPPPANKWKDSLTKMRVNQSLLVNNRQAKAVRASISRYFNTDELKQFTTARQKDGSIRVWRVSQ